MPRWSRRASLERATRRAFCSGQKRDALIRQQRGGPEQWSRVQTERLLTLCLGRVITRLEGSGVVIPEDAKAALRKDFDAAQQGDFKDQSCCAIAVWILYLGRMPKERGGSDVVEP